MEIIKNTDEKLIFSEEAGNSLANAIRRSVQEIEIVAIDEVEFFKNDSALYDEIIAHRLGLIPLNQKPLPKKGEIQLKITAKGPGTVYSSELKEAVFEKMPIVTLGESQELELVATARYGRGKEHTKFSPGLFYYRNKSKIEVDKNCDLCKKCIEACPQKILIEEKKIGAKEIYKCDACEVCVESCKQHGKNAIKIISDNEIVFFVESFGQMPAKKIFIEAVDALKSNLQELSKKL